jgi:hypothetical protein
MRWTWNLVGIEVSFKRFNRLSGLRVINGESVKQNWATLYFFSTDTQNIIQVLYRFLKHSFSWLDDNNSWIDTVSYNEMFLRSTKWYQQDDIKKYFLLTHK